MKAIRGFASDNNAGVHSQVLKAMGNANFGHAIAYGDDKFTEEAIRKIKHLFKTDTEVFFVLTGTGANVLSINALGSSVNSVICAETAHINVDECGAPEKFTGMKLIDISTSNGKLKIEKIIPHLHGFGFEHHSQPGIISITQPTELGTLYSESEIKELADLAHKNNMYLHVDGARISNAVAALEINLDVMLRSTGVDVLSFGGTKNGMMYGEAVVFFNTKLANNFKYYRKQAMQLGSKMRYVGAQFSAFFENNLWLKSAKHANDMAKLLESHVSKIPEVQITQKVESNGVFAIVPRQIISKLQDEYFFYVWDEEKNEVRWMCSFDTTEEDILEFVKVLNELLQDIKYDKQ